MATTKYIIHISGEDSHCVAYPVNKNAQIDRTNIRDMTIVTSPTRVLDSYITNTSYQNTMIVCDDGYVVSNISVKNNEDSKTVISVDGTETPDINGVIAQALDYCALVLKFDSTTKDGYTGPIFSIGTNGNSYCDTTVTVTISPKSVKPNGVTFECTNCTGTYVEQENTLGYKITLTPNDGYEFQSTSKPTCVNQNTLSTVDMIINSDGTCTCITPEFNAYLVTGVAVAKPVVCHWTFSDVDNNVSTTGRGFNANKTWNSGDTFKSIIGVNTDTVEIKPEDGYNFDKMINSGYSPMMVYTTTGGTERMIMGDWQESFEEGVPTNATFSSSQYYATDKVATDIELNLKATADVPIVNYFITQNLTNCTSDCSIDKIQQGSNLTVIITANTDYHFDTAPTSTMNGVTVESSQLETGYQFVFNNVNGDIVIDATAISDTPTEVNNADYGFINIYNPTQSELQNIASKFFINFSTGTSVQLTEYIIGMFQIFGKPLVLKNKQSVKFGKYDTTIGANVVREPKIEIDCGAIEVKEKYNSALDYDAYVNARIWLPFCGFFDIQSDLFMNGKLYLSYTIDVLTGKCIASLKTSQLEDSVVYNFCGSASMKIPYYVNNNEERANGAIANDVYNLADKTPYVLLTRKISATPDSSQLDGINSNIKVDRLGDLTGYTKCSSVDVRGIKATQGELEQLESYLKKGVIL